MIALALGTLLALAALAFVLYPLFADFAAPGVPRPAQLLDGSHGTASVEALREIEFDRQTGKLADGDYAQLKASYTRQAVADMRASDARSAEAEATRRAEQARAQGVPDLVEAAVLAYRQRRPECAHCGPRPETDALFCSRCGRYLPGACQRCTAAVTELGARFCARCGHALAA